jgi:hypothetical protein
MNQLRWNKDHNLTRHLHSRPALRRASELTDEHSDDDSRDFWKGTVTPNNNKKQG